MLIRLIYTLILSLASPLLLYGLYKSKPGKPSFGKRWKEHFGITPQVQGKSPIWIHAVSVGESIAAIPIIKQLKQRAPNQAIIVTTTTSTGAEQIEKLGDLVEHRYMPIDFSWCVRGFLKTVQPKQMLIMETELWPNTLHCVAKAGIPISVLNARLSERSCQRYAKFQSVFNLLAKNLYQVLCQYPSDAKRFVRLGLDKASVHVTGSIKFDIEISSEQVEKGKALREQVGFHRDVWIAASTHQGEDEIVLDAHRQLLKDNPSALLMIVPRHPERFNQVTELAQQHDFNTITRTSQQPITSDAEVYIADTMGEMLVLLGGADVCFMGGSLVGDKVGGHNLLEPAALQLPLLNGPSYFNFGEITDKLLEANAVVICQDSQDIAGQLQQLFKQSELRKIKGLAAYQVVEQNRGALNKTLEYILN
ncbi:MULTISPECIES: lipid IV(A) 3-deoxy-D-manno-octulosonic acid transferase [Vibrio]|uniref:lipid IV(A) 3-deoxy-D-manno-octulosonic acid transferase n=1 Tax=Vibrio TaxID=662 RepID=UPI000CF53BEC|nr:MULTISPECIES: lipid IV(A) 3-deoxy-D-manno-octulosonic acid transferase [Vibrio]CAH7399912.1 KDO transferase [Vibrio chagasii]NOI95735.1 3-deoxy-D-manno-octulosonic acid transferase [Vibrio sp. T3Y01]PQJ57765.1 3-deoxy-D-manno-octulosonic acid transferase [Vibrio splendidus]CAH7419452.1 KDO transferase [Vibrio chagasii]CAH7420932.1 KDO transferase [Vibrio chagasii]